MKFVFVVILFFLSVSVFSQHTNLFLGESYSLDINKVLYTQDVDKHTSFKNLI